MREVGILGGWGGWEVKGTDIVGCTLGFMTV